MRRWKLVVVTMGLTVVSACTTFAGTWEHDLKGWWYKEDNGNYPSNIWKKINNKWYFFNQAGYMETGWIQNEGKWYYCNLDGSLATDQWIEDVYYVGSDGAMYVNCITPDGKKVDSNGKLIVENVFDYGSYIGEYSDLEDYKNDYFNVSLGGVHELKITSIRDNKIYGNYQYGYRELYEENFESGVELINNCFTTNGIYTDYSNVMYGDFNTPKGIPYKSTYTLSEKGGKPVIINKDGIVFYKKNK